VGKDEKYFDEIADRFRDHRVWWIKGNKWYKKDIDGNERDYGVVRLSSKNKKKYYQE
jgi:hypothetical protein